jgi:hypothetical protein
MMLAHLGEGGAARAIIAAIETTTARGMGTVPGRDTTDAIMDGRWIERPELDVTDLATGKTLGRLPECTAAETRDAIKASQRAMKG